MQLGLGQWVGYSVPLGMGVEKASMAPVVGQEAGPNEMQLAVQNERQRECR